MKIVIALLFFITNAICCNGQTGLHKLLIAEYKIEPPPVGRFMYLTAYIFKDGRFLSKDTLMCAPLSKLDSTNHYANFLGKNTLYKNRYVITEYGTVFDLIRRKILWQTNDRFVEAQGDTLIYFKNDTLHGKRNLGLNLKTGDYGFIQKNSWYNPDGRINSPDGNYHLIIDRSRIPYQVLLSDRKGNTRILVHDAKSGPLSRVMTQLPTIETHWLDNRSFLYGIHHRKKSPLQTVYHTIDIRKYDLADNSDELYFRLDSVPQGNRNGYFTKNEVGEIFYKDSYGANYLIDTSRRMLYRQKGYKRNMYGFSSYEVAGGIGFRYNDEDIGIHNALGLFAAEGRIATQFSEIRPKFKAAGVMIWTDETKNWRSFDVAWLHAIVGWWVE